MTHIPVLPDYKLMIPGPVELDDAVLFEASRQITAHYGPEWADLYDDNLRLLKYLFQTDGDTAMIFCSGSGGLEAAMGTVLAPGDRALIANAGFFGARLVEIATARGIEVVEAKAPWGEAVDSAQVAALMDEEGAFDALIAVHHETSTGILNPIQEYGEIARRHNALFIVDAIASLGGDPVLTDKWGIDICVSAPNKCLGAPPGAALFAINPRIWEIAERKGGNAAGWYLNLLTWRRYQEMWKGIHPTPVTVHPRTFSALNVALRQLQERGIGNQWEHYRETANNFRGEMKQLGFSLLTEGAEASSVISVVEALPGMKVDKFIAYLSRQHQIRIGGGLGDLRGRIFRVGHLSLAPQYNAAFLAATRAYLAKFTPS